jgi:hypothetical protein
MLFRVVSLNGLCAAFDGFLAIGGSFFDSAFVATFPATPEASETGGALIHAENVFDPVQSVHATRDEGQFWHCCNVPKQQGQRNSVSTEYKYDDVGRRFG